MAAVISRTAQKTPRFRNILKSITLPSRSPYHTFAPKPSWSLFGTRSMSTDTVPPEVKSNPSTPTSHPPRKAYPNFSLQDRVYVITGGGRGLGLVLAEAIAQAGAAAHCFDRLPEPDPEFLLAQEDAHHHKGSLHYHHVDVRIADGLDQTAAAIVSQHGRLDGLVAAAGVQQLKEAVNYTSKDVTEMLDVNYTGVFMSANAVARQMIARKHGGSIVLVASMSGIVANKGLNSPVYNSSKAAVIQLARNLAMEWGKHGIRVNALCPGHIVTPMVQKNFEEVPGLRETWEGENMLGRLASPEEFTGATVFLLSDSSSFMTGSHLVLDGGHTAW